MKLETSENVLFLAQSELLEGFRRLEFTKTLTQ